MTITIRHATGDDRRSLETCFAELQAFERTLDLDRLPPATMATEYIDWLFAQCADQRGCLYVADADGQVVGFIAAWIEASVSPRLNRPHEVVSISDLVVSEVWRRRGIGSQLLARTEQYAASLGVGRLVVGVLANNQVARAAYQRAGFIDYDLRLVKDVGS